MGRRPRTNLALRRNSPPKDEFGMKFIGAPLDRSRQVLPPAPGEGSVDRSDPNPATVALKSFKWNSCISRSLRFVAFLSPVACQPSRR